MSMTQQQLDRMLKDFELHCDRIKQATSININESLTEKSKRLKDLESDYGKWFEYFFPNYAKSACAPFHIWAAKKAINNPVLYLILEWFRGAAKSVHICMGIPLYLMVTGQMKFMLLIGENEKKAKKLLSDIQAQLQYNQRFIYDYGKQFNHGDWADGDFTTTSGVSFFCLGLGQSPRGVRNQSERPDYIVCDDLDTKERCNNPRRIDQAVEWIMEDLWGCFDEGRERFLMANNRIHKNSILARMVKEIEAARKRSKENGYPYTHFHSKVNAVDKDGEPTWEAKYTREYWEQKFISRPYRSVQREYFNNPIEDGKIFKLEFIQYTKILPLHQYDALVCYGDLSYKKDGDFKAMKLWGKKGRQLHQLYSCVRQCSKRDIALWLYDLYEDKKLQRFNIKYMIEGLFAMDEFVNDFDEIGDERGYYVPVVADKRSKANKFDRIESMAGYWERRNVFYNDKLKGSADHEADLDQLLAFQQGSGAPDDAPDADHGAISLLNRLGATDFSNIRIGKIKQSRSF